VVGRLCCHVRRRAEEEEEEEDGVFTVHFFLIESFLLRVCLDEGVEREEDNGGGFNCRGSKKFEAWWIPQ